MRIVKRLDDVAFDAVEECNIRIGSLKWYRSIEDEARKDQLEGPLPVHVQGKEGEDTVVPMEEFNRLSDGVGAIYRINHPKLRFVLKGTTTMKLESDVNVFIFCTSIGVEKNDALDSKFGSNVIEITDPQTFSNMVAAALYSETFDRGSIKLKGEADSISACRKEVTYESRKPLTPEEISGEYAFNPLDGFVKNPGMFEEEQEFRFMWFPFSNKNQMMCSLPFGFEYIDLNIPDLWSVIRVAT